ncbi:MAG: transporter substrate-binding domain-containing protein [Alphaproteobacteria bacterium]|nr:MAG: transporter substrate-binding domain-containing protein [Alphaproteobacteria bacterium]
MPTLFRHAAAIVLSLTAATVSAVPTSAAEPHAAPHVRLAVREFLPPYVYENAETGIEIDLVRAIFREAGLQVDFVQLPRIRMIQTFDDGRVDGVLTQNVSASTEGCATVPYITHRNVAFTLKERRLPLDTLTDLEKYAVVSFSGATRYLGRDFADAVTTSPRYTESGDQGTHIALLYKQRFDVVVGDEWILRLAQRRHFERTGEYMELDSHAIMPASHYVARFRDQNLCDAFNKAYLTLDTSGALAEIWSGYRASILVMNTTPN